jgi:transposase
VRLVWEHVQQLDLSRFNARIAAKVGHPGRDATDPRILLCLWLVALSEGIGSARRLEELCERDLVYRWICGGVTVNRDLLSSFRSNSSKELDELLSQNIAALMKAGVVTLNAVAQDGMRVRASAGAASFRREDTLKECLRAARAQIERLKDELGDEDVLSQRDAARKRAAQEKLEAVKAALAEMPAVVAAKEEQRNKSRSKHSEPRVSTTDPDARVMKMADGGFRPAFNPQFATDVDSGVIVGLHVTNRGTDVRELETVVTDILSRTQRMPLRYLVDGGYVSHDNIEALDQMGAEAFAPVRQPRTLEYDPHLPRPGEPQAVSEWRARMGTQRGKEQYRERASTAERVNAEMRGKGLHQLLVRGLEKVTSAVLLAALAFNISRAIALVS